MIRRALLPISGLFIAVFIGAAGPGKSDFMEEIRVAHAEVKAVDADSASLSVQLRARMNRSVVIRTIAFDDVTINSIPVHVAPVTTTINVRGGEWITDLPPLQ